MSDFLCGAIDWHYDELPPSNPYKKYLVVYAPWDYNRNANHNPRLAIAEYYPGEGPDFLYAKFPWHLDICHSAEVREILCWANIGDVDDIMKKLLADAYDKCPICVNRNKNCQFGSPDCHFEEQIDTEESEE